MTISGAQPTNAGAAAGVSGVSREPANLGDILERVLDRGLVIVGDIRVSLLDIELLTVKLRLLIASVDTARQLGIDWWEHDPWLSSRSQARLAANAHRPEQIQTRDEGAERPALELTPEPRREHRPGER
jgi:hypothetical protein